MITKTDSKKKRLEKKTRNSMVVILHIIHDMDFFFSKPCMHGSSTSQSLHCGDAKMSFSKRGKGYSPDEVPAAKRFRYNLADAFLTGELAGKRAQELFNDAAAASTENISDLAGSKPSGNSHRNLAKKLMRKSKWPRTYETGIRMKNPKTDEVRLGATIRIA